MHTPKARCFTLEHYPPKNMTLTGRGTKKHCHFSYNLWNSPLFSSKLMANAPRSNSIWTTSEYSPLDYTLFFISSTRHKKRKPVLVHANVTKKSTFYRIVLPPQATSSQRLVNKEHSSSPTTGQTYQLTLHNIDTSPSYSDQSTIARSI